jgi:hypothetical protein
VNLEEFMWIPKNLGNFNRKKHGYGLL